MKEELTFLVSSNNIYNEFIIPYIYFAWKFNNPCNFEIIINDENISLNILNGINLLKKIYNININVRKTNFNINPSFLRFLLSPETLTQYTYIGDIDILICESILNFHKNRMINNNLIYDNVLREYINQNDRFSGLHFVKSNEYFEKTNSIRIKFLNLLINNINSFDSDEKMLYQIMNKSNINIKLYEGITSKEFYKNRPVHGIHLSLNRFPLKKLAKMPISMPNEFKNKFIETISEENFKNIIEYCPKFKEILNISLDFFKIKI